MKPYQEPEEDPTLSKVLREWVADAPLPPRFQEQVWERIARAQAQSASAFRASLTRLLEVVLPRPKVACSYLVVLLALGVAAGSWAAQKQNNRSAASLGSRYLQFVDPYQAASPDR